MRLRLVQTQGLEPDAQLDGHPRAGYNLKGRLGKPLSGHDAFITATAR